MSTSLGTWRRRLRSSSATLLLAALVATGCGAATTQAPENQGAGLAFSRVKGDEWTVWVADADGSDARKLGRGSVDSLSPDGRWVTYVDPYDEEGRLSLLDLETGTTRDLGPTMPLAWSPDGRTLATSNRSHMALVDAESGASRTVAEGEIWFASFSPDGKAIVFSEGYALDGKVLVLRLSDGHRFELATRADHAVWGTSWVAFSRWDLDEELGKDYGPVSRLYIARPDGTGLHELTIDAETAGHGEDDFLRYGLVPVAFSLDGDRLLARISIELGGGEPVTFTVPEGKGRKLVDAEEEGSASATDLSPDGTRVLLEEGALDDEENHVVFTMPFEGGERTVLLRNATQASWADGFPAAASASSARMGTD